MKIRFYLALAAAALVMTNCSQDEELVQVKQNTKGFTATIEGASRSNADVDGTFSWTADDAISVWNGSTFDTYANSEGNESTFIAVDEEAGTPTKYAIYPAGDYAIDGETVKINLPTSYAYGSTNAPMLATITEGSSTLAFKHLGGLMRFVVKNVPVGASSFVFTTTNNILTGSYNVIDGQIYQNGEGIASSTNNNVTITFTELTAKAESMVFFVPLPVGTYGEYTVAIKGDNLQGTYTNTSTDVSNTIGRCTMLLMPEFTCTDAGLGKATLAVIPVTGEDVDLSGIQNVTIGTGTQNDELGINYTPSEGNATLNIKDDSNATESQDSEGKIKINPQGSEAIESLNLNTPSLTAELGAGNYGTVEALTAKQTLIVGKDVTITKLILNGGALQVAEGATIDEIIVKDELGLRSAVAAGGKVTLNDNITLTGFDECLSIKNDCEIALNGKSITHTESTVIKIFAGGKLTIGGTGTVETTDSACGAIGNYGGELIINGGTYKSIEAAAIYCDRVPKDEERKGTWNLTINGGTFTTTSQTAVALHNNRKNDKEEYADGMATIKGGTFTGGGDFYDLYLVNVNADIVVDNCTFTNDKVYLLTKGEAIDDETDTWGSLINEKEMTVENANGMYLVSTETGLRTAVAAGGKVTLIDDITLTGYDEWLSINNDCEIDLNGNSITHAQSTVIKVFAGGKLTIGGKGTVETTDNKCCAISNLGGTLVINGGTYKSKTAAAIYCDRGEGTTWNLTIEDGTFETESQSAVALQNNNGESTEKQGLATINKGTFTGAANWHDLYLCNVIADITASNCIFTKNKGIWLQTVENNTSEKIPETFSSVINGETYDKVSEGVANGYITITDK